MAEPIRMEMGQSVEQLVVEVNLLCPEKCVGLLADDVVQRTPVEVLEDHADVLEASKEGADVGVGGQRGVHAQFGEELDGHIGRVRLPLAVHFELDDVGLLDHTLEAL